MKRHALLFGFATLLAISASAQMMPSTKQECTRRCNNMEFEGNPKTIEHRAKLAQIQERKKTEKNLENLKALEEAEKQEIEKREEYIEKICRDICRNNPEA